MNSQRVVIYEQRRRVLEGQDLSAEIKGWIEQVISRVVTAYTESESAAEWDLDELCMAMHDLYASDEPITGDELREEVALNRESLIQEFREDALETYAEKEEKLGGELMRELERFVVLQVVDQRWREHLENMDYLREGVHLRAMAQKDPLVEYRGEGHTMFQELGDAINDEVVALLFHAELAPPEEGAEEPALPIAPSNGGGGNNLSYQHESLAGADAIAAASMGGEGPVATAAPVIQQRVASDHDKLGRNDPCWCGSGKKYKKCHGA
jgi:preprotein translocase subunit SecA